jgi:segregation and condensation protein A
VVIVHFLALLELARESLVELTQAAPYAPIYVRLAYSTS